MTGLLWGAGYQGEKVNWLIRFVEPRIGDKRMRAKLKAIKVELRGRMHLPLPAQGRWLRQVVTANSTTMPCR
jgi:hypothetical protein